MLIAKAMKASTAARKVRVLVPGRLGLVLMIEKMTVEDVDKKIRKLKAEIRKWQVVREEIIGKTTLRPEYQEFSEKGLRAAEALRMRNRALFEQKCIEAGFGSDRGPYGLNIMHHRAKAESAKIKACVHASNRRVKAPCHLTEDELKLAKIYMKAYTKEWVEFWEGDIRDESWKKNRSGKDSSVHE